MWAGVLCDEHKIVQDSPSGSNRAVFAIDPHLPPRIVENQPENLTSGVTHPLLAGSKKASAPDECGINPVRS